MELKEISSEVVGAQLGQEAVSTSLLAGVIGLVIVCLFMCWVYLLPDSQPAWRLSFIQNLCSCC